MSTLNLFLYKASASKIEQVRTHPPKVLAFKLFKTWWWEWLALGKIKLDKQRHEIVLQGLIAKAQIGFYPRVKPTAIHKQSGQAHPFKKNPFREVPHHSSRQEDKKP